MNEYDSKLLFYGDAHPSHVNPETVRRAIDGDKEAFSELFRCTYRSMFFVARRILARDEDIYDALQMAYTKAYKYIDRLSPPEKFQAWLAKIVENCAKDVWKDTHVADELPTEYDIPTADHAEDSDRRVLVAKVLEDMDPRRAEVLALYYYDGLKLTEIARLLGEPISTVNSRLKAARRELTDLLAQRGIDRSFYSGGFFSAIAVALRSVVGTDILSAAVAQKMMDEVMTGKPGRLDAAAAKLAERQRNKAILRITGVLLLLVVIVALLTSALVNGWFIRSAGAPTPTTTVALGAVADGTMVTTTTSTEQKTTTIGTEPSATQTSGSTTVTAPTSAGATSTATTTPTASVTTTATGPLTTTTVKGTSVTTIATTTTTTATTTTTTTTTTSTTSIGPTQLTENGYTYTVTDGEATIAAFDKSIEGDLVIPSTLGGYPVRHIGSEVFRGTYKLRAVVIPDGVVSIGEMAFHWSKITSVTIPGSVKTIGTLAFQHCDNLTSVQLGNGIEEIGRSAFSECPLTSVVIPDSVTTINSAAFIRCTNLKSIVIPNGVKLLDSNTFSTCESLEEVWLGSGITEIQCTAFNKCTALKTVYYAGSEQGREKITIVRSSYFPNASDWLESATWEYGVTYK